MALPELYWLLKSIKCGATCVVYGTAAEPIDVPPGETQERGVTYYDGHDIWDRYGCARNCEGGRNRVVTNSFDRGVRIRLLEWLHSVAFWLTWLRRSH